MVKLLATVDLGPEIEGVAKEYGPGLGWPEDKNTTHWLENRGTLPVSTRPPHYAVPEVSPVATHAAYSALLSVHQTQSSNMDYRVSYRLIIEYMPILH